MDDEARWQKWQACIRASNIGFEFRQLDGYAGWCDNTTITIDPRSTLQHQMTICVHELAHWYLHFGPQRDGVDPEQVRPELTLEQREFETNLVVKLFYRDFRRNWMSDEPYEPFAVSYESIFAVLESKPWEFYYRRASLAVGKILALLEEEGAVYESSR